MHEALGLISSTVKKKKKKKAASGHCIWGGSLWSLHLGWNNSPCGAVL
jgi:hypothetical protein